MIAGKLGNRVETIAGIHTIVAAPAGNSARRQDMLAFLNWNLPQLVTVFPEFPKRLLIASAGDPMWRGGLSGPASLFLHSDRPLISENRTSTLLHELVHVAMGVRGDAESDWITEGFAEFYSVETLRRSGGISEKRYEAALRKLRTWGRRAPNLLVEQSSGAVTARAVVTLKAADEEIRQLSAGRASLDDVARDLASQHSEVSLELLQTLAAKHAGAPLKSLQRSKLTGSL
jgi:predicted metalloprotease with PDZ domain